MLTIYRASAGSGKTYTLAFEYIKLLLGVKTANGQYMLNSRQYLKSGRQSRRHRLILAITFTNKATEEMKSRIISQLSLLSRDHSDGSRDCPYAGDLIRCFGCTRDELRDAASKALTELLFDYHYFNVSTIDSFFQSVLRTFAREVDRQGDYGVELRDDYAVTSGIGLMLDDLNYGNPPQRKRINDWIRNYTINLVEEGKDGGMFNRSGALLKSLVAYVSRMSSEVFKQKADDVVAYLDDESRMRRFTAALDRRIKDLRSEIAETAGTAGALLADYPDEVLPTTLRRILSAAEDGDRIDIPKDFGTAGVTKLLVWQVGEPPKFYVQKYLPSVKRKPVYPDDSISVTLRDSVACIRRNMILIHGLSKIREACPSLEFLGFTRLYINRFREENNVILLSDTLDLLKHIIGKSDAPYIYERIGSRLRHFLIDEFQDTSHLQWNNLRPLVSDSLAEGCDNLIIGDSKQAIYRFRNSDPELLNTVVPDDFADRHCVRGYAPGENTNYRSAGDIVRFNNTLFSRMAAATACRGYENVVQSLSDPKKDLSAYIRVFDCSSSEKVNGAYAEFELTAQNIKAQHDAGYKWSDIAILVRQRSEAEAVVSYLLEYHPEIKVISNESLLLRNSPAVKMVISMLKLIDLSYSRTSMPGDEPGNAGPVYGTAGDTRLMISRYDYYMSEGYGAEEALRLALSSNDESKDDMLRQGIADVRSEHPSDLVTLVETIIAKKITSSRRQNEFAYLAALQDEVINYCRIYNPSIHSFLDWWDEQSGKLAIDSGSGRDAVNVMTIHKSKGLQWACVHLPVGDWEIERNDDRAWIDPASCVSGMCDKDDIPPLLSVQLDATCRFEDSPLYKTAMDNLSGQRSDNMNVTYVAFTRAERELCVCYRSLKATGELVTRVLAQPLSDAEICDGMIDTAAYMIGKDSDGKIFELGRPTAPDAVDRTDETDSEISLDEYEVLFRDDTSTLTSIDDAIADIGAIMADVTQDSEDTDSKAPYRDERMAAAAQRGTRLHNLLAEIDSADDLDRAVSRLKTVAGLDDSQAAEYRDIIAGALTQAERHVRRWFSPDAEVMKEQSIYLPDGDMTVRPDRIVIYPDGSVDVIDYKFTSETLESHRRQVRAYTNILRQMGHENVSGYLWYPERYEIIAVDSAVGNSTAIIE